MPPGAIAKAQETRQRTQSGTKLYEVTDPTGLTQTIRNLKAFCLEKGVDARAMYQVAQGKRHKSYKGWKVRKLQDEL